MINMLKRWPLYPWLIALYAVLFVYSRNVSEVFAIEVAVLIAVIQIVIALLFGLIFLLTRKRDVSAAILGILVTAFFTYGHIAYLTRQFLPGTVLMYLYVGLMVIGIGMIHRARKSANFASIAFPANVFASILIVMTLPPLISYLVRSLQPEPPLVVQEHPQLNNAPDRPDIYYIVLDGYSSNQHLLRDYGYDNSAFTDQLEQRGFFVAYESKTSYGLTLTSISTVLNMRYIDERDMAAARQKPSSVYYYRSLIADNTVASELQARGYTYIDLLSGFAVPSTIADINVDFFEEGPRYYFGLEGQEAARSYRQGFTTLLLATTSLYSISDPQQGIQPLFVHTSYDYLSPARALMTWSEAEKIAQMPEATFTYVHILKPHEPISFDSDGNIIVLPPHLSNDEEAPYFFDQVEFVNTRTLEMVDNILAASSTPPIIIIQGDHGSVLGHPQSLDGHRTNFEILNAYYLPDHPDCITDPAIIPINSFRSVLNCYFNTDYPMLEPRYFAMPGNYENMFLFEPVDIDQWMKEREANPLYDPDNHQ
jgi:hypothetical protein